jgi:hypothetical protein
MSAIIIATYRGDASRFDEFLQSHRVAFADLARLKRSRGCISHRYLASSGELLVVDEWPTVEQYEATSADVQPEVLRLVTEAGLAAADPPEVSYYHSLPDPGEF